MRNLSKNRMQSFLIINFEINKIENIMREKFIRRIFDDQVATIERIGILENDRSFSRCWHNNGWSFGKDRILRFSSTAKEFKSCTRSERRFPKASKTLDRDESIDEFHRRHFWLWIWRLKSVRCSLGWNRIEIGVWEKFVLFRKNLSQIQRKREKERDFFFWFDF